jgi:hypothetical protein
LNDSAAGHANFGWDSVYTYIAVIVVVVGVAGIVMEGGRSRGCREERGSGRIGGSTTRIEEPETVFEDVGEAACRPIHSNLPCGHIAPGLTDRTHICAGTDVTHICAGTSSQTGPQTSVHGLCGSPVWDCLIPTSRKGPQGTAVQSTALHGFPRCGKSTWPIRRPVWPSNTCSSWRYPQHGSQQQLGVHRNGRSIRSTYRPHIRLKAPMVA